MSTAPIAEISPPLFSPPTPPNLTPIAAGVGPTDTVPNPNPTHASTITEPVFHQTRSGIIRPEIITREKRPYRKHGQEGSQGLDTLVVPADRPILNNGGDEAEGSGRVLPVDRPAQGAEDEGTGKTGERSKGKELPHDGNNSELDSLEIAGMSEREMVLRNDQLLTKLKRIQREQQLVEDQTRILKLVGAQVGQLKAVAPESNKKAEASGFKLTKKPLKPQIVTVKPIVNNKRFFQNDFEDAVETIPELTGQDTVQPDLNAASVKRENSAMTYAEALTSSEHEVKEGEKTSQSPEMKNKAKSKRKRDTPARYSRERSQVPEGGYFAKVMGYNKGGRSDPSDGSSSSSSSSSDNESKVPPGDDSPPGTPSSESEHEGKRSKGRSKALRQAISAMKVKNPLTYSGVANLDVFDQWVYSVKLWKSLLDLEDKWAVRLVGNFLTDKANVFYMKHVAMKPKKWKLRTIFQALFEYCFPPDYKLQLRRQLMRSYQGKKPFRDFARDVETQTKHFPDIQKRQLVQVIWDGAQQYIRLEWVKAGCSPESTPLTELVKKAVRYEAAESLRRRENNHGTYSNDSGSNSFGNKPLSSSLDKMKSGGRESDNGNKTKFTRPTAGKFQERKPRLTKQEMNELRAQGRCFECKKEGHDARNCPTRHTAPAPKLQSNAVNFEMLERLASEKDQLTVHTCSVLKDESVTERISLHAAGIKKSPKKMSRVEEEKIENVERTAMKVKDFTRKLPKPVIIEVFVNGKPARALIDSGSLADFMSTTLADQLRVERDLLAKPLTLQMAVQGSRSKINCGTAVEFRYQGIKTFRRFDIVNLDSYDLILGTPFIFQHKVLIGLNPTRVLIGSDEPEPLDGESVATISSAVADILDGELDKLRDQLRKEAADLCVDAEKAELPPMREVNHSIPLMDENKIYSWRPSRCPDALREVWQKKKAAYLQNGRWRLATGTNASPLLILQKPPKPDGTVRIRTVVDKREQNANTHKLRTPLPDIELILRNVVRHKYRSILDGKDAYEQIRVIPEHVRRTLFTTPDGTMESLVLQQGDCNGPATYQTLMNYIFSMHIGVFMDVYLDDIVIYSNSISEHVQHVRSVFDILRKQRLFLAADKMFFFVPELKILGHVINENGIQMDPHKVDHIGKWKTPTNKDALLSFLGSVSYLASNCKGIRIPMATLSTRTGSNRAWRWGPTEQRAFEEVKKIVSDHRNSCRVAIDYSPEAETINLVTDACLTGASGVITQGNNLDTAKVISFWSGKFNHAQQNYPVHEQELLAIVESLKRFKPQLLGTRFRICTDHKGLEYIMTQKHLSPRQHRWIDTLNQFDFTIHYIPGETNVLADALSRIYSDEPLGTVRAASEYVEDDEFKDEGIENFVRTFVAALGSLSSPVYTGKAEIVGLPRRSSRLAAKVNDHAQTDISSPKVGMDGETPSTSVKRGRGRPRKTSGKRREFKPDELSEETTTPGMEAQGNDLLEETKEEPLSLPTPPSLTDVITEGDPGFDIPEIIRGKYTDDPFFREITEKPSHFKDFQFEDGLLFMTAGNKRVLCIPNVRENERSVREIIITHAHSILAHLGAKKTLGYLKENVWWPKMIDDITSYCKSCSVCVTSKSSTQQPMGLLRTLEVPKRPWQAIGIDFVGPLPASKNRYGEFDQICVIIDHLTSMVHLVPTRTTYKAKDMAEVIFDVVYKQHGLPERIISDRDSLFTSTFWKELHGLLGTELRLSSAYHPQTDGATERANRTMTQMLRQCVSLDQKDWVIRLPSIEYAMNCARSETTGFSPFFLNYGRMPRPLIWNSVSEYPGVEEFAQKMKEAIMTAHDQIIETRVKQTHQANKHRRPAEFKMGELVYLSTKNLRLPKARARKLIPKYIGPFPIVKVVEPGASYKLELSNDLKKRGIHPVFHASLLRIHIPNDDRRFPGRQLSQIPGFGGRQEEWAVDRILSHTGQGEDALFEVLWVSGDVTWLTMGEVRHLEAFTAYCEAMGIRDLKTIQKGKRTNVPVALLTVEDRSFSAINVNSKKHKRRNGRTVPDKTRPQMSYNTPALPNVNVSPTALVHAIGWEIRKSYDAGQKKRDDELAQAGMMMGPVANWSGGFNQCNTRPGPQNFYRGGNGQGQYNGNHGYNHPNYAPRQPKQSPYPRNPHHAPPAFTSYNSKLTRRDRQRLRKMKNVDVNQPISTLLRQTEKSDNQSSLLDRISAPQTNPTAPTTSSSSSSSINTSDQTSPGSSGTSVVNSTGVTETITQMGEPMEDIVVEGSSSPLPMPSDKLQKISPNDDGLLEDYIDGEMEGNWANI